MFKKFIVVSVLVASLVTGVAAQDYPREWEEYNGPFYFASIQSGNNPQKMSDEAYLDYLTQNAISGLAKQMEIVVKENAQMSKTSFNGATSVSYASLATYITDVKLRLVKTLTYHPKKSKKWAAVAYINKMEARSYFKKDVIDHIAEAERYYQKAKDYEASGFKTNARGELSKALAAVTKVDESFFWLKLCGLSDQDYVELLDARNNLDVIVQQELTLLGHATTIYIECNADNFGAPYKQLEGSLKSRLSSKERSFSQNKQESDWIIEISSSAREAQAATFGNMTTFFSYVEASVSLYKVSTGQMIFEDTFSVKGGHTRSYVAAGVEAYKELANKIYNELARRIE